MKKGFRAVAGAVAVAMSAAALTSCSSTASVGGASSSDASTVNLMVAAYSDTTKAEWQQIIKDFEVTNPTVTVNLTVESWTDITNVVTTAVQARKPPDLLNIDAYASFATDKLLYPAKDIISPAVLSDFQGSFVQAASIDGTQWALPLLASARALFYNKAIFAKAGVSSPPATWAELEADAAKIKATGNIAYGMPLGSEEAQAEAAIWFYGAGGGYGTASKLTIDTPENIAGATEMQKLIKAGFTQANAGATNRDPLLNVFGQGKIGMQVGLPQTVVQIKSKNPSLDYGVAAIPTKDGSPFTLGVADHFMAFKSSVDKTAAIKKFLDYFYSADVYTKWLTAEGFLPVTKSGADAMATNAQLKPFLTALPDAVFYPATNPNWPAAQAAMLSNFGKLAQGTRPSTLLKEIQAKAGQ